MHGGDQFKVNNKTHLHCGHPKYKAEDFESGELTAWDTLMEFSQTCKDHEFKTEDAEPPAVNIRARKRS
jgi:hypothetical protein